NCVYCGSNTPGLKSSVLRNFDQLPTSSSTLVRSTRAVTRRTLFLLVLIGCLAFLVSPASASHKGDHGQASEDVREPTGPGYSVPGVSFRVFLIEGNETT